VGQFPVTPPNVQNGCYAVLVADDVIASLNACKHLFLSEIEELDNNGLRLLVREGRPVGAPEPLIVGDATISGGTRIDVTEDSESFELVWKRYVACSVMNESFAVVDDEERYTGNRFRLYSKSHFIDYFSHSSFACDEFPGPTHHVAVVCENHIIGVIAAMTPVVERLP
jgi:hypothetical protein